MQNGTHEFGFRADSRHYTYMLRVTPDRGLYNLYCYCYLRQWLDRHLQEAEKGIRFITPHYKDLFKIQDGDTVRIVTKSGEYRDRTCRYIDEYHMELESGIGQNLYHIAEFAEKFQDAGCRDLYPLRSSLPDMCYSVLESTGELISVDKGEMGYHPVNVRGENMTSRAAADKANKALGISKAQEAAMVAGSMFGWAVPAADPENYNEHGVPIHPKQPDRGEER